MYDEEVGYCQGLSFLAASLLLHVSDSCTPRLVRAGVRNTLDTQLLFSRSITALFSIVHQGIIGFGRFTRLLTHVVSFMFWQLDIYQFYQLKRKSLI